MLKCTRCKEEFADIHKSEETETGKRLHPPYLICPSCREKAAPQSTETDTYQYTRKGEGFRLIAGFNLLRGYDEDYE